jgi:hypothetical protein
MQTCHYFFSANLRRGHKTAQHCNIAVHLQIYICSINGLMLSYDNFENVQTFHSKISNIQEEHESGTIPFYKTLAHSFWVQGFNHGHALSNKVFISPGAPTPRVHPPGGHARGG